MYALVVCQRKQDSSAAERERGNNGNIHEYSSFYFIVYVCYVPHEYNYAIIQDGAGNLSWIVLCTTDPRTYINTQSSHTSIRMQIKQTP